MPQAEYSFEKPVTTEELYTLPRIRELSKKVRIIHFGVVREAGESPWDKLAGMFRMGEPVQIEEMLDERGFEEAEDYL